MEKQYYTAEEAMAVLKMPKSTFYKEVEAGNLPSFIEKGRTRGMKFPKEAIDIHARMLLQEEEMQRTFERATNADIWTAIEHDRKLYGEEDIINYKRALEWKKINNEIFMIMKDGSEISGAVTFMPLEESTIASLLKDKIRERNIPDWAIRRWTDIQLSVYIPTISIFPSNNKAIDKSRGRSILRFAMRWAVNLNKQYDIKNWYAIAATQDGKHLLEALGFRRIEGTREGYILESIDKTIPTIQRLLEQTEQEQQLPIPIHHAQA